MLRLASILYSLIATTLAGSLVIATLVAGQVTALSIVAAAAAGAVLALPLAWMVARRLIGG